MVTYQQADAMRNGLLMAGYPSPIGISAKRGNSPNADGIKCDYDRPDDNIPAETFAPDEQYADYSIHIPTGGGGAEVAAKNRTELSVKQLRARWASRGDGLRDLTSTDSECPLPNQPWINTVIDWPEVRAAWQKKMEAIRAAMGV